MGRDATKAAGNPWYQARKKAAEYDDRLCSRESAAEQLGMSVSSLADAELGNTKFMPVDKAVLKPRGPITAEVPWFNVPLELQKGSESVNDVLRKCLKDFNLEYLNEMGTVWFLYHDLWKCCTHEIKDGKIHFYMACFDYWGGRYVLNGT